MRPTRVLQAVCTGGLLFLARQEPERSAGELRDQIKQHVELYPGLHLSEIARNIDIPTNHAKYHLQRLEDAGEISSLKHDGYWRFFPKVEAQVGTREALGRREKRLLAFLRRPKPLQIALLLLERGEASHGEVAKHLEVAGATAHHHLKKLVEAEMLHREEDGRHVYYMLTAPELVQELLVRYEPPDPLVEGFLDAWESLEMGTSRR